MQRWTESDIQILKDNYTFGNVENICKLLDNKFSYHAITSKAHKLKISSREYWSDSEVEILKTYYPVKTPQEMLEFLPNRNIKTITMKACELKIQNIVTKQLWFSEDEINFIKTNWMEMSDEEMGLVINRSIHAICDKRCQLGLLRWGEQSSYENLSEYVRRNNLAWKNESMKSCSYKCIITGERFDEIHHLYGLNLILNETLDHLNIGIKQSMDDYSENELTDILNTFRIFQSRYPLGICLTKEIHSQFHCLYGYGNNTPEQWYEFVANYKNNNTEFVGYKRDGDESRKN